MSPRLSGRLLYVSSMHGFHSRRLETLRPPILRQSHHLEHNFSHGKQNLAMMFAAMNLLAFALHTICDALEQLWINARTAKRARTRFFEHIRTITAYLVFPNWTTLMQTLIDSKPPPHVETQLTR